MNKYQALSELSDKMTQNKINNNNKGIVKIADLGLACLHKYKGQQHTEDRGNTIYAAPELLKSSNYDTRADIFSLGVILQELFLIDINRYLFSKFTVIKLQN